MERVVITSSPFEPEQLAKSFREMVGDVGAIASFAGYVRGEAGAVETLRLSHYPGMTEAEIERMIETALSRWDITSCHITHRVGDMAAGEAIVYVTAASAHRRDAFQAVDFMMDYLKSEAPFWKQELGPSGAVWIEPREQDKTDIKRWNEGLK